MSAFKLDNRGIKAVSHLKGSQSFSTLIELLEAHLALLDKNNRILNEPNQLLKETGKAQMLSEVLSAIANT